MKVSSLKTSSLATQLANGKLQLSIPPFSVRITSDIERLAIDIESMYGDFEIQDAEEFADFHIEVLRERGLRKWFKPQARFFFDGRPSFIPLPVDQAFAMFEWGLNWCVAAHSHQYLIIHAAVVERNGYCAILPAPPGSGKSTLCAGLVQRGWRLLSDELALCDMSSGKIFGMARPISLKNKSIDVIRNFAPRATFTTPVPDTSKGTLALMKPPPGAVSQVRIPAAPRWVVLPRYQAGSPSILQDHSRAEAFLLIAEQSFNYEIHGLSGFSAVARLLDKSDCLRLTYSNLDEAVQIFNDLSDKAGA